MISGRIFERKSDSTSASAKKLKTSDVEVPINAMHSYRIIHFLSVFCSLSGIIVCKTCLEDKLVINCENCAARFVNSCTLIRNGYEINRRIVFMMRNFGIGYEGIKVLQYYHKGLTASNVITG